jgi:LPLT family lysophospholipid transporter-like MFS transporter
MNSASPVVLPGKPNTAGVWSPGMIATLLVQFLTSVGDNALLFAAIALVRKDSFPAWSGPLLQDFFIASYVLLAPFVGVLADKWPKSCVMLFANSVKFGGALGMCLRVNRFLCYALVGSGAAAYSPAKYGILGDLTAEEHLVKANGLIETPSVTGILKPLPLFIPQRSMSATDADYVLDDHRNHG